MITFDDYAGKYRHIRMERRQGILQLTLHTNGETLRWGAGPHRELGFAFRDVGADPENRVVILTGTGEAFIEEVDAGTSASVYLPPGSRPASGTTSTGTRSSSS